MPTALVFDRDRVDEVDDWAHRIGHVGRSAILWIDLDGRKEHELDDLTRRLHLHPASAERLTGTAKGPAFEDYESYVHVTVLAPSREDTEAALARIECLVSERWIVTAHDDPVDVLETFRRMAEGSGETGRLDGPEFLAALLEWVLGSYLAAFEEVEHALEEFDSRAMEGRLEEPEVEFRRLVRLRRRIGRLRRALVSHRETFLALERPELDGIATARSTERFAALRERLEDVVQSARDARDAVVGSFEILIARSEQRTNEIMKVLTLASLLLLPGSLIAGLLGMNFKLGIFERADYFWIALGLIVGIAAATLVVARLRRWI